MASAGCLDFPGRRWEWRLYGGEVTGARTLTSWVKPRKLPVGAVSPGRERNPLAGASVRHLVRDGRGNDGLAPGVSGRITAAVDGSASTARSRAGYGRAGPTGRRDGGARAGVGELPLAPGEGIASRDACSGWVVHVLGREQARGAGQDQRMTHNAHGADAHVDRRR